MVFFLVYIKEDNISFEGIIVLGTPVGSPDFVVNSIEEISNKYPNFLPRLTTLDTQAALTLLRECHLPIYTHMIRMISPDFTLPYARRLDEQIRQTYEKIVNAPTDTSLDTLHAYHSSFTLEKKLE